MDIVVKKNGLKNYKMNIIDNFEKLIYNLSQGNSTFRFKKSRKKKSGNFF